MNIAVFIAREVGDNDGRAEFPRYGKWFNSHKIYTTGTESKFPYWWEKGSEVKSAKNRAFLGSKTAISECDWNYIGQNRYVYFGQDDSLIICLKKFEDFNQLKNKCVNGYQQDAKHYAYKFLSQIVGLVLHEIDKANLREESIKELCIIEQLSIFIHWGEVDPFQLEGVFAKFVDDYRKSYLLQDTLTNWNHHNFNASIENIRAFAISSRRESCFDVNGDIISVPKNSSEIEHLVSLFEFDAVKDYLTAYVANKNNSLTSDKADVLRRYFRNLMDFGISKTFSSKDAKWMKRVLENDLKDFCNQKSSEIEFKKEIAALFSVLIREGALYES